MKHAFSLVELSIVLVILGLLTGGILGGQSLIRAAELRSVSGDFTRYQAAIYTFRDKYFGLPGDITNATSFWQSNGGTGSDAACFNTPSTTTNTCNGNGNGNVEHYNATIPVGEPRRAWQHLANAGLIEGTFNGDGDEMTTPGRNAPRGRISNSAFDLVYITLGGPYGEIHSAQSNGNQLLFGTEANVARQVALKPEEAWNIDTKMDDGRPDQGALQTDTVYSAACFTGAYPNATYALNVATTACSLRLTLR
jgi:prepilin-type N-terminal cleavage/methylation domain-containing protein